MNKPGKLTAEIPDIQNSQDNRHIPIDKVGIKDIKHPIVVCDRSGGEQHTVANFSMYVSLPHNFKGTHMSRFVEILNNHEYEITVDSFKTMIRVVTGTIILTRTAGLPFFISPMKDTS